jgi:hypothetical protein
MNEFMVHVERIVRPIVARDGRKDRMREELLAHLLAHFEQDETRTVDEDAARRKAIASLGDPVLLRNELQDSVSGMDRFKARIERLFNWHAPEAAWRYTLRAGTSVGALFVLLSPFAVVPFLAFDEAAGLVALRLILLMGLLTGLDVFLLGFLYFKIRDNLLSAFGIKRSWIRIAAYVLASAAVVEGSLLLFLWTTTGELVGNLSLLLGRSLVAFALPLTAVLVAWARGPAELRHTVWECLDIRPAPSSSAATE